MCGGCGDDPGGRGTGTETVGIAQARKGRGQDGNSIGIARLALPLILKPANFFPGLCQVPYGGLPSKIPLDYVKLGKV